MNKDPTVINFTDLKIVERKGLIDETFGQFSTFSNVMCDYSKILTNLTCSQDIFLSIEKWDVKFPSEILELTKYEHNVSIIKKKTAMWPTEKIQELIKRTKELELTNTTNHETDYNKINIIMELSENIEPLIYCVDCKTDFDSSHFAKCYVCSKYMCNEDDCKYCLDCRNSGNNTGMSLEMFKIKMYQHELITYF